MFRNRRGDERGAMLVVTALSLVALLALAGLVIDGGRMYSEHRQVQNSADAASLAGTRVLNELLVSSAGQEKNVYDAVAASITANGTNGSFTCNLVNDLDAVVGACPTTNTGAGLPATASGVQVTPTDSQPTSFMKVVGVDTIGGRASATAKVQALKGASAPFLVCGYNRGDGFPDLLLAPTAPATTWEINPAAIGSTYAIHDPSSVAPCPGGGSGFKGWSAPGNYTIPGWWDTQTGDRSGQIPQMLSDTTSCSDLADLDDCTVIMPICHENNALNGANFRMYCDQWGRFQLNDTSSGNSNNSHTATFLGAPIGGVVATGGWGGGRPTSVYQVRVIKLTS